VIEVDRLEKRFGNRRQIQAVAGATFRAEDGRITGLLGPNGAGKTTLLRALATLIAPDGGSATIDGLDVVRDRYAVRGRIGVLSDARGLYARLTARENVRYYGRLHGLGGAALDARVETLLTQFGLTTLADRRAHGFSQGERMKVAIARALVHDPATILLDEPTNGLDIMSIRSLRELLRGLRHAGKCILLGADGAAAPPMPHPPRVAGGCVRQSAGLGRGPGRMSRAARIRTVAGKEIVDTIRDRRTILVTLLTAIAAGPVFLALIFNMTASQADKARELKLPVAGVENAPALIAFLERQQVLIQPAPADYEAKIRSGDLDVTLWIDPAFETDVAAGKAGTVRLVYDRSRDRARAAIGSTESLLIGYSRLWGTQRLLLRGIAAEVARPQSEATSSSAAVYGSVSPATTRAAATSRAVEPCTPAKRWRTSPTAIASISLAARARRRRSNSP